MELELQRNYIDYEDIYDNINDYEYPYNHININNELKSIEK